MSNTSVTNFGTCWSAVADLTMPAVMSSGFQVVAEAIIRRWSTSRGELIDDPEYGFNLTDLINDDLSTADVAYAQQQAAAEAQKDQRVLGATVTISLNTVPGVLTITGQMTTAQGPFTLVAAVSAVTVQLLQVST